MELVKIKSYPIKTLVMNMVIMNPNYDWKIGQESKFFLFALQELIKSLETGHLGWVFDERCNLFQNKFKVTFMCPIKPKFFRTVLEFAVSKQEKSKVTLELTLK